MGWSKIRHRLSGRLRALARRAEGAAAVEFAIIVPVIGVLMTGTIDLAQLSNAGLNLDGALRAGAGYALAYPNAPEALITSAIQGYAKCTGSQTQKNGCFVAGQPAVTFCGPGSGCPAPGTFAPPQYCTWDDGTTVVSSDSCNPTVVCSGAQCPKHFYVRIRAVLNLTPLLPWTGVMPATVTRTLTVRVL